MNDPRVAVVVLTKDGRDHLLPALDAIFAGRPPRGGMEVVLVDNGSRDGSAEQAKARFPRIRVHRNERNAGFARGVNQGVAATAAEVAVLVNDDAVVESDAIAELVDRLDMAPPETIASAGMLTDISGDRIDFVDGLVTFDGHALQRGSGAPVASVDVRSLGSGRLFPCGGFCALKRRDFERLGGFDEDFFAYLEDVDFGWRATLAGRTTVFVPEARARHLIGATGGRLGLTMRGVLFEANAFSLAYKNLGAEALRALLPAIQATFQHRLMRGLLIRQEGAWEALEDPYGPRVLPVPPRREPAVPPRLSRRQQSTRFLAALSGTDTPRAEQRSAGPGEPFVLSDEYARMWLVASRRIVASWPALVAKRQAVQARRTVPDEEIFDRYPLALVATYDGDEELFASSFFASLLPARPRLLRTTLDEVARG